MRALRRLILVLAAFALIAAACGSDDSDDTTTDDGSDTTEAAATDGDADDEGTDTTEADDSAADPAADTEALVIWADDTRTPVFEEFGEAFEAETGVPVEVVEVDFGTIKDQITQQGPAGEGADVIIGAHDWLGELVQSGVVAPIDLPNASEYEQVALDAFSLEGQLYGVPIAIENLGLFRNTDLVPEPITDWDELLTTGGSLLDDGTVDVVVAVQNAPDPDVYHNYPLQTMYGSYIFGTNDDGTYNPEDLGIASEDGLTYAQAWADWAESGVIDPALDADTAKLAFNEGRAPFYITGPWNLADVRDSGVTFAIDAFPSLDGVQGSPFVGVQGIMVNAFSDNVLLAQAFATDFMATQDAQDRLFELGGRAPAHTAALATAAASDDAIGGFGAAGSVGQPLPAIPEMGAVWGNLTNGYKLILDGTEPGESFTEAQDLIVEAIAG